MPTVQGPSILPVLSWLLPVLLSALLLWRWRGRRIPCPPSCRHCGYDVSRRPAGSETCSECGADLARDGAIVTVLRPTRRWMTATASFLLVASLVWFTLVARRFEWGTWYFASAPDAWVARQAEGRPGEWTDRARAEWVRRYRAGVLPPAQEPRLFDHLLTWQADLSRTWDPAMGDLLYEAIEKKRLSPAQGERMIRGTFANVQFRVRPTIRVGDVVPIEHAWTFRGGTGGSWPARWGTYLHFGGPPIPRPGYGTTWGGASTGPAVWREYPRYAGSDHLTPGRHRLHALWVMTLTDRGSPDKELALSPSVEFRHSVEVDVLERGATIGEPFADPKAADAVATAMDVGVYHWNGGRIFAECFLRAAPYDRAFDVYVEHDGKRHWIARRSAKAGQDGGGGGVEYVPVKDSPDIKSMKMIFVATGKALQSSVDQQKYWKGTIEFPAIPLMPDTAAFGARDRPRLPYRVVEGNQTPPEP